MLACVQWLRVAPFSPIFCLFLFKHFLKQTVFSIFTFFKRELFFGRCSKRSSDKTRIQSLSLPWHPVSHQMVLEKSDFAFTDNLFVGTIFHTFFSAENFPPKKSGKIVIFRGKSYEKVFSQEIPR
jgi:hypothetical protein